MRKSGLQVSAAQPPRRQHCGVCGLALATSSHVLFDTDLVSLVDAWKLPVVRLLSQVVEVAVGQLSAFGGNLHGETSRDAVGALAVHQRESLEVPRSEGRGHLQGHVSKSNHW